MVKLQNVTRAHLGLLLANLVWAVNYPFYKVLMPHSVSYTHLTLPTKRIV